MFNYQPLRGKILEGGYHEGDFESVGVLLSAKTLRPRYIWMNRHDEEGRVFPWSDGAVEKLDDHPAVFVARGSHASYEGCATQIRWVAHYHLVDGDEELLPGLDLLSTPGPSPGHPPLLVRPPDFPPQADLPRHAARPQVRLIVGADTPAESQLLARVQSEGQQPDHHPLLGFRRMLRQRE